MASRVTTDLDLAEWSSGLLRPDVLAYGLIQPAEKREDRLRYLCEEHLGEFLERLEESWRLHAWQFGGLRARQFQAQHGTNPTRLSYMVWYWESNQGRIQERNTFATAGENRQRWNERIKVGIQRRRVGEVAKRWVPPFTPGGVWCWDIEPRKAVTKRELLGWFKQAGRRGDIPALQGPLDQRAREDAWADYVAIALNRDWVRRSAAEWGSPFEQRTTMRKQAGQWRR